MVSKKDKEKAEKEPKQDVVDVSESLTPEAELALCKEQLAAESERKLRILAESENLKKRLVKEKEEFVKYAAEGVLYDLLPVLDNLELALMHGAGNPACKDLHMGVDLTRKIFVETLARHGLEQFGQAGEVFDPNLHEAVGVDESVKSPEQGVVKVSQKGYRLHGRLLRPAKVVVSGKAE